MTSVSNGQPQHQAFIKMKLSEAVVQSEQQQKHTLHESSIGGPVMFESYQAQQQQPISFTKPNQQVVKKVTTVSGMQLGSAGGSIVRPKSQERGQSHYTGQKSVTNKYTKVMPGMEDLEAHPAAQIHGQGISSATNKLKKSFNFESGGLLTQQKQQQQPKISQVDQSYAATSAASRSKKQELMNQIIQNHQLATGQFMSNPSVGNKYLSITQGPQQLKNGSAAPNQTRAGQGQIKQTSKAIQNGNTKAQQALYIQQQKVAAQAASNQLTSSVASNSYPSTSEKQPMCGTGTIKQASQINQANLQNRKVVFNKKNIANVTANNGKQHLQFTSGKQNGVTQSQQNTQTPNCAEIQKKVAKSVSQSKPPAHAQYFNSAQLHKEGSPPASMAADVHPQQQPQQNRTAITTGNGKTQIEIQGNQMLCLWNVNIGQDSCTNYIDQKGSFNLPYQMFQNTHGMMPQQQQMHHYQEQPQNFYTGQQQQRQKQHAQQIRFQPQQEAPHLDETSSKESFDHKISKGAKRRHGAKSGAVKKTSRQGQRQIDINISRKSCSGAPNDNQQTEASIFNKHFKRQVQQKASLNIRTKKQMSTEAIHQSMVMHQQQTQGNNTTTAAITKSTRNSQNSTMAHVKQMILQKIAIDANDSSLTTQNRLVKLLANVGGTTASSVTKQTNISESTTKPPSRRGKAKVANSSSMEHRRGSKSSRPQSRDQSHKKGNAAPLLLLQTDNHELVEFAQQHMPRVNLSTTNKTTRDTNLNFLETQKSAVIGGDADNQIDTLQKNKKLKKMGMLVNNYFDQQEHIIDNHNTLLQSAVQQQQQQQKQSQFHKRMQSQVPDPQFISQLQIAGEDFPDQVTALNCVDNQQKRGHTTKNMKGNPNTLFLHDPKQKMAEAIANISPPTTNQQDCSCEKQQQHELQDLLKNQQQKNNQAGQVVQQKKAGVTKKQMNAIGQIGNIEANTHAALVCRNSPSYLVATGQTAPKAKKQHVEFKEEDLASSEFNNDEDWMKKIEAEWRRLENNNRLINFRSEESLLVSDAFGKGVNFNNSLKGSLLESQMTDKLAHEKIKTQDVTEILRRAKQEFISRETAADPYEEDCVVKETDPDEDAIPKHKPAQNGGKPSNLSQRTLSTSTAHQAIPSHRSPKNNPAPEIESGTTESLLHGAFMREQKQQQRQQQQIKQTNDNQQTATPITNKTESKPAAAVPEEKEAEPEYPMPVRQALKLYAKSGKLTDFEKTELLDFKKVYFLGLEAKKIPGKTSTRLYNSGYDDENGDYQVILKDHLYYRFEVMDFLGKGSFGQALRCYDHKTDEIVAVKIIKNKERYQHQAGVELRILQHLQSEDPEDQYNIIQIKDHCIFRNHLIISFELFSINLYEFIKNNNFQGVSLSLIRRFAIQILQSLKFLREQDVIHCDLKPENILLKSPDKSGIKIIDFGSSCFSGQRIYSYIQSRFYRAPEIIIGIPYTTAIDMWSFGCILIELYTGMPIFPGESETEQLALIMQTFGKPPLDVLECGERRGQFFQPGTNEPLKIFREPGGDLRLPGSRPLEDVIGDQSHTFFDFICQCLDWNPEQRITPFEALQHPWILEGLPKVVRIHHQRMLGLEVQSESSQASLQPCVERAPQANGSDYYRNDVTKESIVEAHKASTMFSVPSEPSREIAIDSQQPQNMKYFFPPSAEHSNALDNEDGDDYIDDEVLDVHNRSVQQNMDQPTVPGRIIDNGMANQFRVESIQNKQQQQAKEQAAAAVNNTSKQEMSRTQPMPGHILQGTKKAAKQKQLEQQQIELQRKGEDQFSNNLNYQSLENGQQMLQFPELPPQQQQFQRQSNGAAARDQLDQHQLDELEQRQKGQLANPKSKTTNMTGLLKQINKSIEKPQWQQQPNYELDIGAEKSADKNMSGASGMARFKLPQTDKALFEGLKRDQADNSETQSDFYQIEPSNGQQNQQIPNNAGHDGGVSFLMKHRIRQTCDQPQSRSSWQQQSSSQHTQVATTTGRPTAGAEVSNHGNNKNVNKIALGIQREHELIMTGGGDYALAAHHSHNQS